MTWRSWSHIHQWSYGFCYSWYFVTQQGLKEACSVTSHGPISCCTFYKGVSGDRIHSRKTSYGVVNTFLNFPFIYNFSLELLVCREHLDYWRIFNLLELLKKIIYSNYCKHRCCFFAAYMLWLSKRVIFGTTTNSKIKLLKDLNFSESLVLGILVFLILFFVLSWTFNRDTSVMKDFHNNYQLSWHKILTQDNMENRTYITHRNTVLSRFVLF